MKAAAYARVSTADQVDGFSLAAQLRAIRAHCDAQGWTLTEYTDEGVSASKESAAHRPAFKRLMDDVDARRVDVVIVHKLDRFSRNLTVTLQSLARIDRAGAAFVSVVEHIDMATPMGRLMLKMMASFAEFYSDNLASEVSKGRAERARQGLWNGDLPFGYRSTGDPRQPPVIVPAEAALVREAFERYASGTVSAHAIASWLNEQGARPRSKRGLTRFTKATITDMLANRFYTGTVSYRGDLMPGAHDAIVDAVLFERVERVRHSRRRLGSAVKRDALPYLLRGIARCSRCGQVLWCSRTARGRRYRDSSRLKQERCDIRFESVGAEIVESQVAALLRDIVLPEDWHARLAERLAAIDSSDARARRAQAKARLARLRDLYLEGDFPRGRYDVERARLLAEIERCDVELTATATVPFGTLRAMQEAWEEATDDERAKMASLILEEVYIDLDTKAVTYVKPRPAMLPLFALVRDGKVQPGDPERARGATAALSPLMMVLRVSGVLFTPSELAA